MQKKDRIRTTFEITIGHYLEISTPETIKLLWIIKNKRTKKKRG